MFNDNWWESTFLFKTNLKTLFLLVHYLGEIFLQVNTEIAFDEAKEILNQDLVDRIGHATFLHPLSGGSESLTNIVKEKKIPIGNYEQLALKLLIFMKLI